MQLANTPSSLWLRSPQNPYGLVSGKTLISLDARHKQTRGERWMQVARAHDSDLHQHSVRVSELAAAFGATLGFSFADQDLLTEAALLHDIGKSEIPLKLLLKPAALTQRETIEMHSHAKAGYLLLMAEGGYSSLTLGVVRDHHERLDGTGYPNGLLAADISDPVRIVTLCDIYAAMTEPRVYGVPLQGKEALLLMAMKRTRIDLRLMKPFEATVLTMIRNAFDTQ
jgi:putative nucleotidyltransferase with HDIG domain